MSSSARCSPPKARRGFSGEEIIQACRDVPKHAGDERFLEQLAVFRRAGLPLASFRKYLASGLSLTGFTVPRDFDRLGRWLLEPVLPASESTVYLMPFGPLVGFPLDALRVDGRLVIERHRFAYVESLAAAGGRPGQLEPGFENRVFLAGNPRAGRDLHVGRA